jgi:hypothetical protein
MKAETALTKGIALCEKVRLIAWFVVDPQLTLYVASLYRPPILYAISSPESSVSKESQGGIEFHRSPYIRLHHVRCFPPLLLIACSQRWGSYKHIHWVYAFRFLKASFYPEPANAADAHAIDNLRKISALASQRGDNAISVIASLLESLAYLGTMKDDVVVRVQTCIAQASKFQLDESIRIPQIDVLIILLDLSCSLLQKHPAAIAQKRAALHQCMDRWKDSPEWDPRSTEILLPIKKQPGASLAVSTDTQAILRPGHESTDYLVLSILGKQQSYALAWVHSFPVRCGGRRLS